VVGVQSQPGAEHVGAGDEGEEAEAAGRVGEVGGELRSEGRQPARARDHEHGIGQTGQPEQQHRHRVLVVGVQPDRDDAGRHHQCEVAGVQRADAVPDRSERLSTGH
jgi:hypothetical protein